MKKTNIKENFIYQKIGGLIVGRTSYQKLARLYIIVILLGFGVLSIPQVQINGQNNIFSNFFTSVSAFTTTGLTIKPINCSFNTAGQIIVLMLIQIGGLGVVTVWMFIKYTLFREKKHNVEERINLHSERGGVSEGTSYDVVKSALKTLFTFEIWIATILTFFFYFVTPESGSTTLKAKNDFWQSLWAGVFHSISAVNNAGLDIISKDSIMPYSKGWGIILSAVFAFASIIGGIGYPVLYEVKKKIFKKDKWKTGKERFSLFTKISLLMYSLITVLAGLAVVGSEQISGNLSNIKSSCINTAEKIWQLIYLVISSRSAGFSGLELSSLHEKTQWILLILMFIGASPASTAGGIRSITLFLIIGKIWITVRGKKSLSAFSRTIPDETIESAYMVFFVSSILITIVSLFISSGENYTQSTNNGKNKHAALFEASSAFGTSGLTLGITSKTNWLGQILLVCLMFIGQMGVPNVLLYWTKPKPYKQNVSYPEEKIRIA